MKEYEGCQNPKRKLTRSGRYYLSKPLTYNPT